MQNLDNYVPSHHKKLKNRATRAFGEKAFFVFSPYGPNADFRAKNAVFWPEIHFFPKSSKFFVTIMTGHQKDNIFVLTPIFGPKICIFFTLHLYNPHF